MLDVIGPPEPWMRPHLAALEAAVRAGFRFYHLPRWGDVLAIQGVRTIGGVVEFFLSYSATDALAARVRIDDLDFHTSPQALWDTRGTVADVLTDLLALPPHGTTAAPTAATTRLPDLWLPGRPLPDFPH